MRLCKIYLWLFTANKSNNNNTAINELMTALANANTCTLNGRSILSLTCVKKLIAANTTKEKTIISKVACLSFLRSKGCGNSFICFLFSENEPYYNNGYYNSY